MGWTLPFKAITGDHSRFSGVRAEYLPSSSEINKRWVAHAKVNLILCNKAINEEAGGGNGVSSGTRKRDRERRTGG